MGSKVKIACFGGRTIFCIGLQAYIESLDFVAKFHLFEANSTSVALTAVEYDLVVYCLCESNPNLGQIKINACQDYPPRSVCILPKYDESIVDELLELKVNGILMRNSESREVRRAIEQVLNGKTYYAVEIVEEFSASPMLMAPGRQVSDFSFSNLDIMVLEMICLGYSDREICAALSLTRELLLAVRSKLLEKSGMKNMNSLIVYTVKHNLLNI